MPYQSRSGIIEPRQRGQRLGRVLACTISILLPRNMKRQFRHRWKPLRHACEVSCRVRAEGSPTRIARFTPALGPPLHALVDSAFTLALASRR